MNMTDALQIHGLRGQWRREEPMARHVSWRAGGRADRCYVPADLDDLSLFLAGLPAAEPLLFVGLGSNLLVRDGGFRGTVILMHGAGRRPALADGGDLVYAEAGVASPKVARFAAAHDFAGAEFMAGIPGTVGGALAMNAGCYGGETWSVVDRVLMIDRRGTTRAIDRAAFDISGIAGDSIQRKVCAVNDMAVACCHAQNIIRVAIY